MIDWKNKKIIVFGIILIFLVIIFLRFGSEDSWIKDKQGIYVKHGNPSKIPDYVLEQQKLISDAIDLYEQKRDEGVEFSSQCLGTISDYAIDIVHVPRIDEDNLAENQCEDYRDGSLNHFLELDKYGNLVRID